MVLSSINSQEIRITVAGVVVRESKLSTEEQCLDVAEYFEQKD